MRGAALPTPRERTMDLVEDGALSLDRIESSLIRSLRAVLTAKNIAEARQHGCHYAEGACDECAQIARNLRRLAGVD